MSDDRYNNNNVENGESEPINSQLKEWLESHLQLLSGIKDKIEKIAALKEVIGVFEDLLEDHVEDRLQVLQEKKASNFAAWTIIDVLDEARLLEVSGKFSEDRNMAEIAALKEELNRIEMEMLVTRRAIASLSS